MFDILIRGGHLIDPAQNLNGPFDIAIKGRRVAAVLPPSMPLPPAKETIDVAGKLVVPGLIDFHVHVFPGVSHFGIETDPTCLSRGVTTVLDFGTAGGLIFGGFRRYVIDEVQTRVLALLHIAGQGLIGSVGDPPLLGELHDLRYCDLDTVKRVVDEHGDVIKGIKIRCTANLAEGGRNEAEGLARARKAADMVGLPLVVHSPDSSLSIHHVLDQLRPGDVLTHCFHGKRCGLVDSERKLIPGIRKYLDDKILLDVGHGFSSFNFQVARSLMQQNVIPDFISSDIHHYNLHGPVIDLVTTMDKFLHLGMDLVEVIRRTTQLPARFLGREEDLGTLRVGAVADITVIDRMSGSFPLTDSEGNTEMGKEHLEPTHVFRAGCQLRVLPHPIFCASN